MNKALWLSLVIGATMATGNAYADGSSSGCAYGGSKVQLTETNLEELGEQTRLAKLTASASHDDASTDSDSTPAKDEPNQQ